VHQKGAAIGTANSFAYFGAFMGGMLGGWVLHTYSRGTLALIVLVLCVLWFLWVLKLRNPGHRGNVYMEFDRYDKDITNEDEIRELMVK